MSGVNTFLLLGEAETPTKYGKLHTVPDNQVADLEHKDKKIPEIKNLIPVLSGGYGIVRGDARPVSIPINLSLDCKYLPLVHFIQNFTGANGYKNRIHAAVLSFFDDPFDGKQKNHHNRTFWITDGYIHSLSYAFNTATMPIKGRMGRGGSDGDFGQDTFTISLAGTNFKMEYYMPDGDDPVDIGEWSAVANRKRITHATL